jgi:hypothetical protein
MTYQYDAPKLICISQVLALPSLSLALLVSVSLEQWDQQSALS